MLIFQTQRATQSQNNVSAVKTRTL